jgi:hypothetical protein
MNIANLELDERGRDAPSGWQASRLHEDRQGPRGRAARALSLPLEPNREGVKATARSEGVTALAIATTTFALLLGRLAGGRVALAVRLKRQGEPTQNPTFIAMTLDITAAPDLISASHEALRILDAAILPGVSHKLLSSHHSVC